MADQTGLIQWLLSHKDKLDLQVLECTWAQAFFPGLFDLQVELTLGGRRYKGRGADRNADVALSKAAAEAVERYVCKYNDIGSCGVAAHITRDLANQNATLELFERIWLREHMFEPRQIRTNDERTVEYQGQSLRVRLLTAGSDAKIIALALADGLRAGFGCILGLAAGKTDDVEVTREKALIECLRNVTAQISKPEASISLEIYRTLPSPSADDQRRLLLDLEYGQAVLRRAQQAGTASFGLRMELLSLDAPHLLNCPLYFSRARCHSEPSSPPLEFVG